MWSRSLDVAAVCYPNFKCLFFSFFLIIIITPQFQEKKLLSIHVTQSFLPLILVVYCRFISFLFLQPSAKNTQKNCYLSGRMLRQREPGHFGGYPYQKDYLALNKTDQKGHNYIFTMAAEWKCTWNNYNQRSLSTFVAIKAIKYNF